MFQKLVFTAFGLIACFTPDMVPISRAAQPAMDPAVAAEPNLISFSHIDKAWDQTEGHNVKVAILDWLFDVSPEASQKYEHATSVVPGQPIGFGEVGHGDWMVQIVHAVAPKAKIIPIRARPLSREGDQAPDGRQVYEEYLTKGIRYAADQGAAAVTNSMGPVKHCDELRAAIDYAEKKGTLFINVHPEYLVYTRDAYTPCDPNDSDKRIIHAGIVAVPKHPARANPGRNIYVWPYSLEPTFRDGWGYSNGPPIIAGVIALIKSANPALTPADIRTLIQETATPQDGFNVLNAQAAVKRAIAQKP